MTDVASDPIRGAIPHREPFLFVSRVLEQSTDRIVTEWDVSADHDFFRGHYPGSPLLPGVLLLVPGTVGVHGVEQLLAFDIDGGLATAVRAIELAGALAGGLFAGQALAMQLDRLGDGAGAWAVDRVP